jgi:hypothetical protein
VLGVASPRQRDISSTAATLRYVTSCNRVITPSILQSLTSSLTGSRSAKQVTLDYLAAHKLAPTLESLVNRLVTAKPSNPWAFVVALSYHFISTPLHRVASFEVVMIGN